MARGKAPKVLWVLGFDPGTKCGWALLGIDSSQVQLVNFGLLNFTTKKTEGGGIQALRMSQGIRTALELLGEHADDLRYQYVGYVPSKKRNLELKNQFVAFEEIRFHGPKAGVDAAHLYGAVTSRIMGECEDLGIPFQGINPSTARKQAWGKGNLKKPQIKRLVEREYGIKLPGEKNGGLDIADAVTVARAFVKIMGW